MAGREDGVPSAGAPRPARAAAGRADPLVRRWTGAVAAAVVGASCADGASGGRAGSGAGPGE
ncbi:hypothetical protein [Streptomyces sp. NPDC048644]|uniref:hypothetical protein n=1 Tax=Streptomyces sp. NPDC048644 TaxID=3365582 RepID=UPI0037245A37